MCDGTSEYGMFSGVGGDGCGSFLSGCLGGCAALAGVFLLNDLCKDEARILYYAQAFILKQ